MRLENTLKYTDEYDRWRLAVTRKSILKSNFHILFEELKKAVNNYLDYGHIHGEIEYINAFLTASIHSLIDYTDRYFDSEDAEIMACKYVNNTLKHNDVLVTHSKPVGGFTFPITYPIVIPKIEVLWNYDKSVKTRHPEQQRAFEKLFAGKPIIETLQPIADRIESN